LSPEIGCVVGVGLWGRRVARRSVPLRGLPLPGFLVAACGGERAGEAGCVGGVVAGGCQGAEAVDGGLAGAPWAVVTLAMWPIAGA